MKVAHVVATVDDPVAGPSQSVRKLCQALTSRSVEIAIHTVAGWRDTTAVEGAGIVRHPQDFASTPVLGRLCMSGSMAAALQREAQTASVMHSHGLWLMPNVYQAWATRRGPAATMISVRGMLGPAALSFSSAKKKLFWNLLQRKAVEGAGCMHATGASELAEIRDFGVNCPVAVIPNGVDVFPLVPRQAGTVRTLLTLGRIHPKKGLPNLIQAWARLEPQFPDWRLRIVGPSEGGHAEELQAMVRNLNLAAVSIEGPMLGEDKAQAYQSADLFVLPTLNENFALTVAEALAAGVPVVATKGAPWAGLEANRCGWWVDIGAEPLAAALAEAMSAPVEVLSDMGGRGHAWMARDFSWDHVADEMIAVYRWLDGKADAPPSVHFN